MCVYGTSKIRLVTWVGKVSGRTGATCNAILILLVYSGSVVITEEQWTENGADIFHRKKSQLTSDSFCGFYH